MSFLPKRKSATPGDRKIVCNKIHLKSLNQYTKNITGDYSKQFVLDSHSENKNFLNNPYIPGQCNSTSIVEFDLVQGARSCYPQQTQMLNYDVQGNITVGHMRF